MGSTDDGDDDINWCWWWWQFWWSDDNSDEVMTILMMWWWFSPQTNGVEKEESPAKETSGDQTFFMFYFSYIDIINETMNKRRKSYLRNIRWADLF